MRTIAALFLCALGVAAQNARVIQPKILTRIDPSYTDEARLAKVNATVMVGLTVTTDGRAKNIFAKFPVGFGLEQEAIKAVADWRFEPARLDGEAVEMNSLIEVTFRLLDTRRTGQVARLIFEEPGAPRPVLLFGVMPENPPGVPPNRKLRIEFTVLPDGSTQDAKVLESNPPEWSSQALDTMRAWRFSKLAKPVSGRLEMGTER